jgi:hypothetical protein
MNAHQTGRWKACVVAIAAMALVAGMVSTAPSAYAGGTIKVDDDKWISLGMGIRASFGSIEDASASGGQWGNNFGINNARLYVNGKIHKYVGFEFNTECFNCYIGGSPGGFGENSNMGILDAIGKFEINDLVNVWVGRLLVPTERGELNGPYYHAVFDGFRTPFSQSDFSGNAGLPGGAGLYGRDNGAVFFGKIHPGGTHLQYVAGIYTGMMGPINPRSSPKYAGRLTWNLLNEEKNPGYYTSGTYYGTAGDILALAFGGEYQNEGAGSAANRSRYGSAVADLLFEKVLADKGVVTVNAEFKRFWAQDLAAFSDDDCFCTFGGTSWTGYVLYLFPQEIGIGRFQPYGRYTGQNGQFSGVRDEYEFGLNYVIDGHNARISTYWRTGNIGVSDINATFGGGGTAIPIQNSFNMQNLNYGPGSTGQRSDAFFVAVQLQY